MNATAAVEAEVKLDVDDGWVVPDLEPALAGVLPGSRVVDRGTDHLSATYLDTTDHRLLAARVTLRRRAGGHDAGWHLKLPLGSDRLEVRHEAEQPPPEVPNDLVRLVRSRTLGASLAPVMELRTQRHVRDVLASDGTRLIEVVDDEVVAQAPGGTPDRWRELEAEIVDGTRADLDAVVGVLLAAGARPAATGSKLARALGESSSRVPVPQLPVRTIDLAVDYLCAQVGVLVDRDAQVRLDRPEAVHDMRVATRRLRSALATHGRRFDPVTVAHLRAELRQLGTVLGSARDAEVLLARLGPEIAGVGVAVDPGAGGHKGTSAALRELQGDVDTSREALLTTLDSERHLTLLRALDDFVTSPPERFGGGPAPRGRHACVRHDLRRVRRALDVARDARDTPDLSVALHEVRKAAKSARYTAESVAPLVGARARAVAVQMAAVQDVLGAHQDDVVARARLERLIRSARDQESASALSVLASSVATTPTEVDLLREVRGRVREAWQVWRRSAWSR